MARALLMELQTVQAARLEAEALRVRRMVQALCLGAALPKELVLVRVLPAEYRTERALPEGRLTVWVPLGEYWTVGPLPLEHLMAEVLL